MLRVFISYAADDVHDANLFGEFRSHLSALVEEGQIRVESRDSLLVGQCSEIELLDLARNADLHIILLSAALMASHFLGSSIFNSALARHEASHDHLYVVEIRACDVGETALASLPRLTAVGQNVRSAQLRDPIWVQIVHGIRARIRSPALKGNHGATGDTRSNPGPAALHAPLMRHLPHHPERPSALPVPPGGPYDLKWYVRRENQETDALLRMGTRGIPAVLRAPVLFGKSQTFNYLLNQQRAARTAAAPIWIAALSLRSFLPEVLSGGSKGLELFCEAFARELAAQFEIPGSPVRAELPRRGTPAHRLKRFVEQRYLLRLPEEGCFILAIDHADQICDHSREDSTLPDQFFGMLRSWLNESRDKDNHWKRLRLLLCISHTANFLIRNPRQSPFNLTASIELPDFDLQQCQQLAAMYNISPHDSGISALRSLLGGHPYLCRFACYHSQVTRTPLSVLLSERQPSPIFSGYLKQLTGELHKLGSYELLRVISKGGAKRVNTEKTEFLDRLGLITSQSEELRLRYPLYQRLFSS